MKYLLTLLLLSPLAWSQAGTTAVTAQIKDTNNALYVNCQWSVTFVHQNTSPNVGPDAPAALLNGQQGHCDSSGNLSVNLADNINTITPTPSQWSFSICSAPNYTPGGIFCQANMLVTITGASMNLTSTFQPLMPLLPSGGGGGGCSAGGAAFQLQTNNSGLCFAGITNVAAGSLLASNGTSAFPVFQTKSIIDVRDYGAKCDGSTNDTTAVNNALAVAVAIGTSLGTAEVAFPSGICIGNFTIVQGKGLRIHGTGELSTRLRGLGSTAALQLNGLWYSSFSDMSFDIQNHSAAGAVLEIDGNYDGIHTQSIQFLAFNNVLVTGLGANDGILSNYAVAVCRQSVGACQGSNLIFNNAALSGASSAVYYQNGTNALANVFNGGDIQNYTKDGVRTDQGDLALYSTSFESTVGYDQVNNGGCDIRDNTNYYAAPVYDVRSESVVLLCGTGYADVRGLNAGNSTGGLIPGTHSAVNWAATTAFTLGQVTWQAPTQYQSGATNWLGTQPLGNMYYKVTTAGTSGGSLPNWPYTGTITDGSVVWTAQVVNRINLPKANCSYIPLTYVVVNPDSFVCRGPRDLNVSETHNNVANPVVTTNATIDPSDELILVDASSNNITLTVGGGFLNTAPQEGHLLYIRRIDAADTSAGLLNTVTLNGNFGILGTGKTIANYSNFQLPPDSFVTLEWTTHGPFSAGMVGWVLLSGNYLTQGNNSNFSNTAAAGAVKLNAKTGFITSESLTTAAGSDYVLTFTNNRVNLNSVIVFNVMNGTNTGGMPTLATVNTTTNGVVTVDVHNSGAAAFNGTLVLKFQIL